MQLLTSKFLFISFALFISVVSFSQDFSDTVNAQSPKGGNEEKFWSWDKVMVGGSGGAQFGDLVAINLTPSFGYRITPKLQAGFRIPFQYVNDKIFHYKYFIYGTSIFTRYFIWNNVFLHAEPEALNGPWEFGQKPFYIYNVWVGGGYMFPIGGKSGAYLSLLFNLNNTPYTRYMNPNLQAGFLIGL